MEELYLQLSDFDWARRREALLAIAHEIRNGKITSRRNQEPFLNLHIHSFHSFNYRNWSPSRIILEAYLVGLKYAGIVDFDTLAGLEETRMAARELGVPVISGVETRVFVEEYADKVINSPGEPGIHYINGLGFSSVPAEESLAGRTLAKLRQIASNRNKLVIERLNRYLSPIAVDYERDVVPITPSGNPTERHIVLAYARKADEILKDRSTSFWSEILKISADKVCSMRQGQPGEFMERVRSVLVKSGGPGYIVPKKETFPSIREFAAMVTDAGGIVAGNWLDGTTPGEQDIDSWLEYLKGIGASVMTIIPERNWNIQNPEEKRKKVANLHRFMETCKKMGMPVVTGTEMNKFGQPFVDNFRTPELSVHLPYFMESARKLIYMCA